MREDKTLHIEQDIVAEAGAVVRDVQQQVITYQQLPTGAPFQAPAWPAHFVSRPEVSEELKERLLADQPATSGVLVVSAIHGLGGIGKSVLAAALAHDEVIALISDARAAQGMEPLLWDEALQGLAEQRAWEIVRGDASFHEADDSLADEPESR